MTIVGEEGGISYLELLVATLAQHEKTLSRLIERLEVVCDLLDKLNQRVNIDERWKTQLTVEEVTESLVRFGWKSTKYIY